MISQVPFGIVTLSCRTSQGSQFLIGSPQKWILSTQDPNTKGFQKPLWRRVDSKACYSFQCGEGMGERNSAGQFEFPINKRKDIWRLQVGLLGLQQGLGERKGKMAVAGSRFLFSVCFSFFPWGPGGWQCHWTCYSKQVGILNEDDLTLQFVSLLHVCDVMNLHLDDRELPVSTGIKTIICPFSFNSLIFGALGFDG